jgi:peptide/nickel transport system substrate-binding protein
MVSPRRRVTAALLAGAMLLTVVISACGGSSSTGSSGAKGTLTVVPSPKGNFTANFNPLLTGATNDPSFGMIYEPLMAQNRFDGTAPKPWLATSATWNSDFTSITFKLRTDVKWSDGQPFSADDVVYTFNLLQQYPALDTSGLWTKNATTGKSLINSVSNSDSSTVVMTSTRMPRSSSGTLPHRHLSSRSIPSASCRILRQISTLSPLAPAHTCSRASRRL